MDEEQEGIVFGSNEGKEADINLSTKNTNIIMAKGIWARELLNENYSESLFAIVVQPHQARRTAFMMKREQAIKLLKELAEELGLNLKGEIS